MIITATNNLLALVMSLLCLLKRRHLATVVWRTCTLNGRGLWLVRLAAYRLPLPINATVFFPVLSGGELTPIHCKRGNMADLFRFFNEGLASSGIASVFFLLFRELQLTVGKVMAWTTKTDNFATTQVNDPRKLLHPATKLISFDKKRVQEQFQMNLAAVRVETDFSSGSKIVYQSGSQTYLSNNFKHAFTKACCDRTLHVLLSKINFRFYAKPNSIFIGYYGFQKCDQAHVGLSVI